MAWFSCHNFCCPHERYDDIFNCSLMATFDFIFEICFITFEGIA